MGRIMKKRVAQPSIKTLVLAEAARSGIELDKHQATALNQLARGRPALFHRDAFSYLQFLVLVGRATTSLPFDEVSDYAKSAFVEKVDRPFHMVKRTTHIVPGLY